LVLLLSHRFRAVCRYRTCRRSPETAVRCLLVRERQRSTATPGAAGGILLGQQTLVIALVPVVMAHLGLPCPEHGLAAGAAIRPEVGIIRARR
jgi:hypothetical protein